MVYVFSTASNDMWKCIYGSQEFPVKIVPFPPSVSGNNVMRKIAHALWKVGIFIKWDFFGSEFNQMIDAIGDDDYVIFYAIFPEPILNIIPRLKKKTKVAVWLWDKLDAVPYIRDNIELLKKTKVPITTIDPLNANDAGIRFVPQLFKFSNLKVLNENNAIIPQCDVYFLGHTKDLYRKNLLDGFANIAKDKGISLCSYVVDSQEQGFISYETNLDNLAVCKAVLELNQENQVGLTLRTMEALAYRKKLITNNPHIKDYDFYRKENVFILGEDNINDLKSFLYSDYCVVPMGVLMKYDYNNWLKLVTAR